MGRGRVHKMLWCTLLNRVPSVKMYLAFYSDVLRIHDRPANGPGLGGPSQS